MRFGRTTWYLPDTPPTMAPPACVYTSVEMEGLNGLWEQAVPFNLVRLRRSAKPRGTHAGAECSEREHARAGSPRAERACVLANRFAEDHTSNSCEYHPILNEAWTHLILLVAWIPTRRLGKNYRARFERRTYHSRSARHRYRDELWPVHGGTSPNPFILLDD